MEGSGQNEGRDENNRIVTSDRPPHLKIAMLDTLAICCIPGNGAQQQIIFASTAIKDANGGHEKLYGQYIEKTKGGKSNG